MSVKEAVREATRLLLQRATEKEAQREWAFGPCPHERTRLLVTPEYQHQICVECGAERIIRP
jgi:hypothetical protein